MTRRAPESPAVYLLTMVVFEKSHRWLAMEITCQS